MTATDRDQQGMWAGIVAIGKPAIEIAFKWQHNERVGRSTCLLVEADAVWQGQQGDNAKRLNERIARELNSLHMVFLLFDPGDEAGTPTASAIASYLRQRVVEPYFISFAIMPSASVKLAAYHIAQTPDPHRELGGYAYLSSDEALEVIELIWGPVSEHGFVCFQADDLRSLLSKNQRWFHAAVRGPLDTAEAVGKMAAEKVVELGARTSEVTDVLFTVEGGKGTTLHIVNDVAVAIDGVFSSEANYMYQAFIGDDDERTLRVNLMVGCGEDLVKRASAGLVPGDATVAGADVAVVRWTS